VGLVDARSDNFCSHLSLTKMDVVGCHHVAEYGETEAFLRFENPAYVPARVTHSDISGNSCAVIFINVLNEGSVGTVGTAGTA
jgi:hypothetical protein